MIITLMIIVLIITIIIIRRIKKIQIKPSETLHEKINPLKYFTYRK